MPEDHTHRWRVFVKGINDSDISYWLKKVQFKLHETYAQAVRTVEGPPFEVQETGWGEFEIQIKLYFVPESLEKPQTLWHSLKLHPYGPDAEGQRERRDVILAQNYEELVFNEPVEQFYDLLTGGSGVVTGGQSRSKADKDKDKTAKQALPSAGGRTAEIPATPSATNPYSRQTEQKELERIARAMKTVGVLQKEEKSKLMEREKVLEELRKSEGIVAPPPGKKK